MPLDPDHRLSYDLRNSDNLSQTVSWYDTSDKNNTWGVSAGTESQQTDAGAQFSGNYQHYSPLGDLNVSGSYKANDYSSLSASWNGPSPVRQKAWPCTAAATATNRVSW